MMLGGGFQYGRKITYSRRSMKIGVLCWSDLPTTTFMRSGSSAAFGSVAHRRKSGTFTNRFACSLSWGSQRMRSMASWICRTRWVSVTFRLAIVPAPRTPSGSMPWRRWKLFTASTSGAYDVGAAASGRSPNAWRRAATAARPSQGWPGSSFFRPAGSAGTAGGSWPAADLYRASTDFARA